MVLRRQVFEYTGFRPDIFNGINMGDGETGLLIDLVRRNLEIAFVPDAYVHHHMDKSRYNLNYVRQTAKYYGAPLAYWKWHKTRKTLLGFVFEIGRICLKYHRAWIKYVIFCMFSKKIISRKIDIVLSAYSGFEQIKFIYLLITDRYFLISCDWDDFRPESCIKLYEKFSNSSKKC